MSQKIDELIGTGVIEKTKGDYIKEKFQDFTQAIEEWSERANAIVVTDESQKELMSEAREGRLLLKAKRIEVEKVRKSLKEQSLTEGRMIDSVAKYLTNLIEPAEKHLELQEKFIEIQEQNKRIQLKAVRIKLLESYKDVIDPDSIQLDLITDEAFNTILNGAKFAQENKKAEALRIEEEQKEIERKKNLYLERKMQILEYKQFLKTDIDSFLTVDLTEDSFDYIITDLRIKKDNYLKAQTKLAKENEVLKKQNKKKAQEIKQLKQVAKQMPITKPTQSISSDSFSKEQENDSDLSDIQNKDVIMIKRSDYLLLKKRYLISKTTLESVLCYIVPKNLRDLVNEALEEIKETH